MSFSGRGNGIWKSQGLVLTHPRLRGDTADGFLVQNRRLGGDGRRGQLPRAAGPGLIQQVARGQHEGLTSGRPWPNGGGGAGFTLSQDKK